MSADPSQIPDKAPAQTPKKPKKTLDQLIAWAVDHSKADVMSDGTKAGLTLYRFTEEDKETLLQMADVLVFFDAKWKKLRLADKHWPLVETLLRNNGIL